MPSFFVSSVTGGGLTRVVAFATPFLLPLMFQLGFGMDAAQAGLMLLPYFLGNLLAKTTTTPLIRRFGFWRILVTTACLNAVLIGAVALMPIPRTQVLVWAFSALLFIAGVPRSIGMTGMATLTFADIPPNRLSDANTLNQVFWQITQALGVALATLFLRTAMLSRGGTAIEAIDFRFALAGVAALCVLSALSYGRMRRNIGAELTRRG
jgi:fucose permease